MYYSKCNVGYILRIEIGEEIQETLRQFAHKVELKGAFYQGIGMLTQVELAFFCSESKEYERKFFDGEYELTSLMGNLSAHDGVVAPHTHVSIADKECRTFSGHLVRGVVPVTAEIILTTLDISLSRKEDPFLKYKGLITPRRTHFKITV